MRERSINTIIKNSAFRCVVCGERMLMPMRAVQCFCPKKIGAGAPSPAAAGGIPRCSWHHNPPHGAGGLGGVPCLTCPHPCSGGQRLWGGDGVSRRGWSGFFICISPFALPCLGVSCFSYIVAWESCVTVKKSNHIPF